MLKILFFSFLFIPCVLFSQEKNQENSQIAAYLEKVNWEYLFPNQDFTIGSFDAKIIEPALVSIKPLELKMQKYSMIEVQQKPIYGDSVLINLAKEKNISIDSIQKIIEQEDSFSGFYYKIFGTSVYNDLQIKANFQRDTILKTFVDKENQKVIISSKQDTFIFFYDKESRLIEKKNKVLMQRSTLEEPKKWTPHYEIEKYYYSYFDNSIQSVEYQKDTTNLRLLTKKEYRKIPKELPSSKKHSFFYYVKNGNKYEKYYVKERYDTMLVKLNSKFQPMERIKYTNGLNNKKEVTKYIYNEREQVILSDKKTYGSNEVDGSYIDSSKIILNYDKNNFLTERKYLWYSHFHTTPQEQSEFYLYKIKMEDDLLYIRKNFQQKDKEGVVHEESEEYVEYWIDKNGEIIKTITCFSPGFMFEQRIKYFLR